MLVLFFLLHGSFLPHIEPKRALFSCHISCHTVRCFDFEARTEAGNEAQATKDPDALLRINDGGVAIAPGGDFAGSDCPGNQMYPNFLSL